jgi:hypothetical protein
MQTSTFPNGHLTVMTEILNYYIDNHPERSEDMKRFVAYLKVMIVDYKELLNQFHKREIEQKNLIRSFVDKSPDNSLRELLEPCLPMFLDPRVDALFTLLSKASERVGS